MEKHRRAKKQIDVSVGESVRIIRELQELSQNELSRRTGIPQSTISLLCKQVCFSSGVSIPEKRIFSPFKTIVSPSTILRLFAKEILQDNKLTIIIKNFFIYLILIILPIFEREFLNSSIFSLLEINKVKTTRIITKTIGSIVIIEMFSEIKKK